MPDDNPATQPDDDIAMTTVVAQTWKKKIEGLRMRPATGTLQGNDAYVGGQCAMAETKLFRRRLKKNRQIAERDAEEPLSSI